MKKIISLVLVLCIILASIPVLAEENEILVRVNEKDVLCMNAPFLDGDSVMVPFRAVAEAMGAEVKWDNEKRCAIAVNSGNIMFKEFEVKAPIGESVIYRGEKAFQIEKPAVIVNDCTFVSVNAFVQGFAAVVNWKEDEKLVEIFMFQPGTEHNPLRKWYTYDDEGRLLSWCTNGGEWEWYTYDENGNKIKSTNYQGYVNYTYDENNNCIFYEDFFGFKIEYTYDERGNLIKEHQFSETYHSDYTNEYTYNEKGQKISKKYDDGSVKTYIYDENGNLVEEKTDSGSWTKYTYDEKGNLTYSVTDYGAWKKYEYDSDGRKTLFEDSEYKTRTTYEYDENGNLVRENKKDGDYIVYEYNEKGQMIYSESHYAE